MGIIGHNDVTIGVYVRSQYHNRQTHCKPQVRSDRSTGDSIDLSVFQSQRIKHVRNKTICGLPWIKSFWSLFRRFTDNFPSWLRHSWKLLVSHAASDPKMLFTATHLSFFLSYNINGWLVLINKTKQKNMLNTVHIIISNSFSIIPHLGVISRVFRPWGPMSNADHGRSRGLNYQIQYLSGLNLINKYSHFRCKLSGGWSYLIKPKQKVSITPIMYLWLSNSP